MNIASRGTNGGVNLKQGRRPKRKRGGINSNNHTTNAEKSTAIEGTPHRTRNNNNNNGDKEDDDIVRFRLNNGLCHSCGGRIPSSSSKVDNNATRTTAPRRSGRNTRNNSSGSSSGTSNGHVTEKQGRAITPLTVVEAIKKDGRCMFCNPEAEPGQKCPELVSVITKETEEGDADNLNRNNSSSNKGGGGEDSSSTPSSTRSITTPRSEDIESSDMNLNAIPVTRRRSLRKRKSGLGGASLSEQTRGEGFPENAIDRSKKSNNHEREEQKSPRYPIRSLTTATPDNVASAFKGIENGAVGRRRSLRKRKSDEMIKGNPNSSFRVEHYQDGNNNHHDHSKGREKLATLSTIKSNDEDANQNDLSSTRNRQSSSGKKKKSQQQLDTNETGNTSPQLNGKAHCVQKLVEDVLEGKDIEVVVESNSETINPSRQQSQRSPQSNEKQKDSSGDNDDKKDDAKLPPRRGKSLRRKKPALQAHDGKDLEVDCKSNSSIGSPSRQQIKIPQQNKDPPVDKDDNNKDDESKKTQQSLNIDINAKIFFSPALQMDEPWKVPTPSFRRINEKDIFDDDDQCSKRKKQKHSNFKISSNVKAGHDDASIEIDDDKFERQNNGKMKRGRPSISKNKVGRPKNMVSPKQSPLFAITATPTKEGIPTEEEIFTLSEESKENQKITKALEALRFDIDDIDNDADNSNDDDANVKNRRKSRRQAASILDDKGEWYVGKVLEGTSREGRGIFKHVHKGRGLEGKVSIYKGEFSEKRINGQGVLRHASGSVYDGTFHRGYAHGYGICIWPEGWKYEGEWAFDKRQGRGRCFQYKVKNGELYEGQWLQDEWHGKGKLRFAGGGYYVGEFKSNRIHGNGKYKFADGGFYDGDFIEEGRDGHGTMNYVDGSRYVGYWKDNWREGYGTMFYKDGTIFNGTFHEDEKVKGEYLSPDGEITDVNN